MERSTLAEEARAFRQMHEGGLLFLPNAWDVASAKLFGESEIAALVRGIGAPLNLIAGEKTPSVPRLEALGVARLSFGPRPMRAALQLLRAMAREWLATGTYAQLTSGGSLSCDEVNAWFTPGGSEGEAARFDDRPAQAAPEMAGT